LRALKALHPHSRNDALCEAALSRTARFGSKQPTAITHSKFEKAKRLPFSESAAADARLISLGPGQFRDFF
jgi:hypothetical protein